MLGSKPWFVPKPRGYGAVPASWEGWAAIGVAVAAMVMLAVLCFGDGTPTVGGIIGFIVGDLLIVVALVVVARAKTRGEWRWRMRVWSAEDRRFVKAYFDTSRLPPEVWFVRSGRGQGLMPVKREGNRVVLLFVLGMLGSGLIGALLMAFFSVYAGVPVVVIGMAASGAWFIYMARRHGDSSINAMDLVVKVRSGAVSDA